MRDEFPTSVIETLRKRVNDICSRPGCDRPTSGPQKNSTKAINVGVAAHITAASKMGARYDPNLTSQRRKSIENGIWLCQFCAKLVDNDAIRYPTSLLRQWKELAEDRAIRSIEAGTRTSHTMLKELEERLISEMRQRNLFDFGSVEFARTKFSRCLCGEANSNPTSVVLFALMDAPLIEKTEINSLVEWMNPNNHRSKQVPLLRIVPGFWGQEFGKALVWHDGTQSRFPTARPSYSSYFAVDVGGGYMECGYTPANMMSGHEQTVHYSELLAYCFSFTNLVKRFVSAFHQKGWKCSIGMAVRGTKQTLLHIPQSRFAFRFGHPGDHPEKDGLLWYRKATLESDWTVDEITERPAIEILDHWSVSRPIERTLPEFDDDGYTGDYYSDRCRYL